VGPNLAIVGIVIVRLLRFAAFVTCGLVIASFVIFAVGQTKDASSGQQAALRIGTATASASSPTSGVAVPAPKSGLHRVIDEASERLTSPFEGITPASNSEWLDRIVKLILALAVYGFALGFVARWFKVRA
jgi:hypothetical protein